MFLSFCWFSLSIIILALVRLCLVSFGSGSFLIGVVGSSADQPRPHVVLSGNSLVCDQEPWNYLALLRSA